MPDGNGSAFNDAMKKLNLAMPTVADLRRGISRSCNVKSGMV